MNRANVIMSKITERGQITLPKKIREAGPFSDARAVLFSQHGDTVTISPVRESRPHDEHMMLLDTTMNDWSGAGNDDLFDFSKAA